MATRAAANSFLFFLVRKLLIFFKIKRIKKKELKKKKVPVGTNILTRPPDRKQTFSKGGLTSVCCNSHGTCAKVPGLPNLRITTNLYPLNVGSLAPRSGPVHPTPPPGCRLV